jgi:phospholipase/carboxylesterase
MNASASNQPNQKIEIGQQVIQARVPPGNGQYPVFVMLHGWTGDENSMWIFASRLPAEAILLSPRGLYVSPRGGYSWYPKIDRDWPRISDFDEAISALVRILSPEYFPQGDFSQLRLVGFSQGAALAYCFAFSQQKSLRALAGLSGFMPEGVSSSGNNHWLEGLPVFIAHGTQDELVPVERARRSAQIFQEAGAVVSYCEHEAGHKLNASCFRSMEIFFEQN